VEYVHIQITEFIVLLRKKTIDITMLMGKYLRKVIINTYLYQRLQWINILKDNSIVKIKLNFLFLMKSFAGLPPAFSGFL